MAPKTSTLSEIIFSRYGTVTPMAPKAAPKSKLAKKVAGPAPTLCAGKAETDQMPTATMANKWSKPKGCESPSKKPEVPWPVWACAELATSPKTMADKTRVNGRFGILMTLLNKGLVMIKPTARSQNDSLGSLTWGGLLVMRIHVFDVDHQTLCMAIGAQGAQSSGGKSAGRSFGLFLSHHDQTVAVFKFAVNQPALPIFDAKAN